MQLVPIGTVVGERYRIDACLASDGSRGLFEAIDAERDAPCAVKLVRFEALGQDGPQTLVERSRKLVALDHPHIVRVHHAGMDEERELCFVATDLLRGADLGSISKSSGPLPPERVADFVHQLASALDAAHRLELFHGCLSLTSLFLTHRADGSELVVLLDLEERALLPRPSARPYRAPELEDGVPTRAADVYALGPIAYALLTGEPHADGTDEKPSTRAQPSGVHLSPHFDRWFAVATAPDPGERFAQAHEAAGALELALEVRSARALARVKLDALSKTLPADDEPESEARPSVVDPLGDTQGVGASLARAAKEAIAASGRRRKPPVLTSEPPPVTASSRTTWLIVLAVAAVVALALFAALRP